MSALRYLALFSLLAVLGSSKLKPVPEEDDVLVLDDENFAATVEQYPILLVEFYALWCGHCKSLAPEYAKAAKALKELDPPLRVAKIDADKAKDTALKYGIQGFPTFKLFKGDIDPAKAKDFDAGRTAKEIVEMMKNKAGPPYKTIYSQAALDAAINDAEVVVLGIVSSLESEEKEIFESVASANDNVEFVITNSTEIAAKYEKTAPALILFKSFDEGKVEFTGTFTVPEIETFVKENFLPLVMTFSQEKATLIFGGDTDVHLLVLSNENADYHKPILEKVTEVAKDMKRKLLHIVIPPSEDRILDYFGYKEENMPAIVLVNTGKIMKKFSYPKEGKDLIDSTSTLAADLKAFENDYFENKLIAKLKSKDPEADENEAVKIIVGKDFQKRVIESGKDVLLEFYAPWCGHCKSLAPKYETLAEKFAGVDSIMIAKMDATENEIDYPGVDVQGFPTIILFPAKGKPVDYNGERDVNGFTEFLKENANIKFDLDNASHGGKSHDEL